jgi:Sec-independent protein translocase protein TatA
MEIFGVGPLELAFIVLLALIVLGPADMLEGARKLARLIRRVTQSDLWRQMKEVQKLPTQIMRETGLEDELRQINLPNIPPGSQSWTAPRNPASPTTPPQTILPPQQATPDASQTEADSPDTPN